MLTFNPNPAHPATSNTIVGRTTRFLSNNWHHLLLATGAIGGFVYFGTTPILDAITAQWAQVAVYTNNAITKVGISMFEALVAYSAVVYPVLAVREGQRTRPLEKANATLTMQLAAVDQTQVKAQIAKDQKELEAAAQLIARERAILEAQKAEFNEQSKLFNEQVKAHATKVAKVAKNQGGRKLELDTKENELIKTEQALKVQKESLSAQEQALKVQQQILEAREQEFVELKSSLSQHAATPLDSGWDSLNNDNLTEGEIYSLTPPSPTLVNAYKNQVEQDQRDRQETLLERQGADNIDRKSRTQSQLH